MCSTLPVRAELMYRMLYIHKTWHGLDEYSGLICDSQHIQNLFDYNDMKTSSYSYITVGVILLILHKAECYYLGYILWLQMAVIYPTKESLMLPLIYEGLAGFNGLILILKCTKIN